MSLDEALEKVRKRLEELSTDIGKMKKTSREVIKTSRPKPLRQFLESRVDSFRPLKLLEKRRPKEESASTPE
jgi:phage shock protein A